MAHHWNQGIEEKHRMYAGEDSPTSDASQNVTSRYSHISQPCHVLLEGTTRRNIDDYEENENARSVSGTVEKYNMTAVLRNMSPATSSISPLLSDEEGLHTQAGRIHTNSSSKSKRDRWSNHETAALILSWKENLKVLESGNQSRGWKQIMAAVDNAGSGKSIKQIKTKMKNMKDLHKNAERNSKITGVATQFPPFYHEIDEILGDSSIAIPKVVQAGVNYNNAVHQVGVNSKYTIQHVKEETGNGHINDDDISLLSHTQYLFSGSADRSTTGELSDEEESGMTSPLNQPGTKNKPKKIEKQRRQTLSFYSEMIAFQREVLMVQMEQEKKHQAFMREIIDAQRKSEAEERRKDRDFFLQLAHVFKNSK